MFLRGARLTSIALVLCGVCGAGCGARTGIYLSDAGVDPPPVPCVTDLDCATGDLCAPAECREGICASLPATVCDDHDACTSDSCDPDSGKCAFTPVTLDLDGDGHRSPKPGFAPGAPGACGDDCNDSSAAAHPGGVEICDGVDNDCNGVIDDGAAYGAPTAAVRVSSSKFDLALNPSLAFDGKHYGAIYTGHNKISSSYFNGLARDGTSVVPETPLTDINSETYAGTALYNGSFFERSWEDARRDGNYEVYFNRFDSNGKKLGPDVQVTNAPDFSLNSVPVWNGTQTLLVWDDRRFSTPGSDDVRLFGQLVAFDGSLVGGNLLLTGASENDESPDVALGQTRVGIAFTSSQHPNGTVHTKFLTTAPDLSDVSASTDLGGADVQGTRLVSVSGHFLVAWEQAGTEAAGGTPVPHGPSVIAAVVDENGAVLQPARPVTSGATIARSFSLLSLGDRALLFWADNQRGNFEIYWQILGPNLEILTPRTRLTSTTSDSFFPSPAFGPNGDVGVLYVNLQTNFQQIYFVGMGCVLQSPVR
jgi:hypothetical protein